VFILRVSLDPESEGSLQDLDEPLDVRLGRPLVALDGLDGVGEIDFAPDDRSAFVSIMVTDDVDVTNPEQIGRLVEFVDVDLADTPFNVELYMSAPGPEPCSTCGWVDGHDLSKHVASVNYAVGLTRL
jgi:hypothetical protein